MWFCVIFLLFLRIVYFQENYMLFKSLLRITWVMISQQPFCKTEKKVFFIDFIEIFQSKMKRLHMNKGFYLIILEKIVDSMPNYSQLSSRLYTSMTAFFTLIQTSCCSIYVVANGNYGNHFCDFWNWLPSNMAIQHGNSYRWLKLKDFRFWLQLSMLKRRIVAVCLWFLTMATIQHGWQQIPLSGNWFHLQVPLLTCGVTAAIFVILGDGYHPRLPTTIVVFSFCFKSPIYWFFVT